MKQLLNQSERRQLLGVEILHRHEDWMTLSELSKKLDCSVRVLKDDIAHFKNNFDMFTIETSNNGIRLNMNNNTGLKSLYQHTLNNSTAFNLLENIFLNENISIIDLTKVLYVSSSTIYRLIDQINEKFKDKNFKIETNPCRIIGSENEIRYFFYNYFYEKYSSLDWPYKNINENGLDKFLQFFIEFTQIEVDFAYYNVFKTVSVINLIRYKQGYCIDTSNIKTNFDEIIPNLAAFQDTFHYFEQTNQVKVNNTLIQQMFTPYINESFSLNYERLIKKTETDLELLAEINFLNEMLDELSEKHKLSLSNKESVILNVHNAAFLEYMEPRSGYILHNHNQEFASKIKSEFFKFYENLYEETKKYRQLLRKPLTDDGINFIMYIIFIFWENLLPELRKKLEKIHILVISDRHISHSKTIKEIIEYEFHEQIVVDVYDGIKLDSIILKKLPYDIIVANFPLPILENRRTVYVENLPSFFDLAKIREKVDEIILERML